MHMPRRALIWIGGLLAVAALVGLTSYFIAVGLEEADKLASIISSIVGIFGLATALLGATNFGKKDNDRLRGRVHDTAAGGVRNAVSRNASCGVVMQGNNFFGPFNIAEPNSRRISRETPMPEVGEEHRTG
jgi:uncharacterized membrane protein